MSQRLAGQYLDIKTNDTINISCAPLAHFVLDEQYRSLFCVQNASHAQAAETLCQCKKMHDLGSNWLVTSTRLISNTSLVIRNVTQLQKRMSLVNWRPA